MEGLSILEDTGLDTDWFFGTIESTRRRREVLESVLGPGGYRNMSWAIGMRLTKRS